MNQDVGMTELPEATQEILRKLARSVALHRRGGGVLDSLPAEQQDLLQAMNEAQRQFFTEELAKADAEEGRSRFRAQLAQRRARQPDADPEGMT
jgi:hypothetical protein